MSNLAKISLRGFSFLRYLQSVSLVICSALQTVSLKRDLQKLTTAAREQMQITKILSWKSIK